MRLYNLEKKDFEASTNYYGIKLDFKVNQKKWDVETKTIDGIEYEFYTSNYDNLSTYYYFIYKDKWYRIRKSHRTIFMGDELYTRGGMKRLIKK